jgi:hypothetical protein
MWLLQTLNHAQPELMHGIKGFSESDVAGIDMDVWMNVLNFETLMPDQAIALVALSATASSIAPV